MWETLKKQIKKIFFIYKEAKPKSFSEECLDDLIFLLKLAIAKIGYCLHGSIAWSIMDYFFPIATLAKWLVGEEINMQIIKNCFNFFVN